jgi:hypothetical protein
MKPAPPRRMKSSLRVLVVSGKAGGIKHVITFG